ncbi:hypothetical protein D043_3885B, partial [Vibrio parahaemolyticus EKP-021]
TVREFELKHT